MLDAIMGNTLVKAAALDVGIQWGCWSVAAILQTEKFYDLAGSSSFILLTLMSLRSNKTFSTRQSVNSGMVFVWATRLGFYLFSRILKEGNDKRFNGVRNKPGLFWVYWTVQAVWVFATLLPTLIVNSKKEHSRENMQITTQDYVGWGLWGFGFLLEALADYQKSQFRSNPDNEGKFITSGLWSISQHPNYLGDILLWCGLYISATSVLKGWEHIGIISPILISYLLTQVSGIPMLERAGLKRWGADPLYQEYIRKTARLIPFVW